MDQQKIFGACPHDCPDTCAVITTVRDGKRSRSAAILITRSPAADCASKSTTTKAGSTAVTASYIP